MKRLAPAAAGVFLGLMSLTASAQGLARIPTVTRLVSLFSGLEEELSAAVRRHDGARLSALLAEDFELRSAHHPGIPVPRAEWLAAIEKDGAMLPRAEQMAARDMGGVVLVSYLGRRREGGNLFVVDTWRQEGADWKLVARYAAPAGEAKFRIPGDTSDTGVPPKKAE